MKVDLGLDIVRPHSGSCAYLQGEIVIVRRSWEQRLAQRHRQEMSALLALCTSDHEPAAVGLLEALLEQAGPLLERGCQALEACDAAMDAWSQRSPVEGAIAWTDGHALRIAFKGQMRVVLMQQGHAKRVLPVDGPKACWFETLLDPGDWLIVAPPCTDAALPLGSILRHAAQCNDAAEVCRTATAQAARVDQLNHHAVLAARIVPA